MAGEGVNVANAYVQIIPSAQGVKQNITDALVPEHIVAPPAAKAAHTATAIKQLIFTSLFILILLFVIVVLSLVSGSWPLALPRLWATRPFATAY